MLPASFMLDTPSGFSAWFRSRWLIGFEPMFSPRISYRASLKSIFRGVVSGGYDAPAGGSIWQLMAIVAVHKVRRNASKRSVQKRDVSREQPLGDHGEYLLATSESPEEFEVAIRESVECLSPLEQSVVMLRVQGYSVEEISQQIDRSRRSVERVLQNVREKFADMLISEPAEKTS